MLKLLSESPETRHFNWEKKKTRSALSRNHSLSKFDTFMHRVKQKINRDCNHPIENDMSIAKNCKTNAYTEATYSKPGLMSSELKGQELGVPMPLPTYISMPFPPWCLWFLGEASILSFRGGSTMSSRSFNLTILRIILNL